MMKLFWLAVLLATAALADVATPPPPAAHAASTVVATLPTSGESPPRSLGLAGAPNFRDVGGYATTDHRHVRWGTVYRSNALNKLTPADAERVDKLDLKAVVDLRTQEERSLAQSVWDHRPVDVYESPKQSLKPVMATILKDAQTPAGARSGMEAFYASMPDLYRDEYAAMFHRIAAGELPILVHCTAGKDRTGVAMAVLLRSLKVSRSDVVADYELTERLVPAPDMAKQPAAPAGGAAAQTVLAQLPEASRVVLWQSRPEYLEAALDSIDREYGSVDRYLIRGLGLTPDVIASVRRALTQ